MTMVILPELLKVNNKEMSSFGAIVRLYSLETSENGWFTNVFRSYRKGTLVQNGLKIEIYSKLRS